MQSLFILGRQPALGLAELESLYGAPKVQPIEGQPAALLDVEPELIDFDRLGGSVKFARLLTVIDSTEWHDIEKFLIKAAPEQAARHPEGKLTIGISVYGLRATPGQIQALGLTMKKAIKKSGRSVRLVPNKEPELNTAQVLHNHLTHENGWELLLVRQSAKRTILAQTIGVQDIESYTVRDRERPYRDTRVGMLPPKLAQMLVNLSVGELKLGSHLDYIEDELGTETTPKSKAERDAKAKKTGLPAPEAAPAAPTQKMLTILDPFCGTGVVLQEALLSGYDVYGTDIDARMVEYTQKNIAWLHEAFEFQVSDYQITIERGDATSHNWNLPPENATAVASETYLGRPFTAVPPPDILQQTISECNLIIKKFLRTIHPQVQPGTRLALAVPAWQIRRGNQSQFKHLPLLAGSTKGKDSTTSVDPIDLLGQLGYNRISFEHARTSDLLYFREDQIVARELLILEKKLEKK